MSILYLLVLFSIVASVLVVFILLHLLILMGIIPAIPSDYGAFDIFIVTCVQAFVFIVIFRQYQNYTKIPIFTWKSRRSRRGVFWKTLFGYILLNVTSSLLINFLGLEIEQFENLNKEKIAQEPMWFYLSTILIAPIYEEYIFRGIILGVLYKAHKFSGHNKWVTNLAPLIFSSLIFALMHGELDIFPVIFLLGIFLGWLTLLTRSTRLSIIVHLLNNFVASWVFLNLSLSEFSFEMEAFDLFLQIFTLG